MEPVVERPEETELHLLTDWSDPDAKSRHWKAAIGAVFINVVLIVLAAFLPEGALHGNVSPEPEQHVTPLVLPPLTQKDPNNGRVSKEFEVRAAEAPRRAIQQPPSPPPVRRAEVPTTNPAPAPAPPPAPLPDAPKVEQAKDSPPPADLGRALQQPAPPPPQIQTAEKPKLTFESVPPATQGPVPAEQRRVALPNNSVTEIAKEITHGGGSSAGLTIGDAGASGSGYSGLSQTPAPGNPLANIQLQTDTEGVDMRPYLMQILQTIKRNWFAVMPQSAHMGRHGKVALQFAIEPTGKVTKVVYAEQSGARPLDLAAVAAIEASNPLPPLPRDFKGPRVVLQLNFVYR